MMKIANKLVNIIQKLQPTKIVTACLLATFLLVTTGCNNGSELGARPENPPVQLGGQNNPHKAGGDGMTKYKATDDPRVLEGKNNASLPARDLLAAANQSKTSYPTDDNQLEGVLYPGDSNQPESLNNVNDIVSPQRQKELLDPRQIPAKKQPGLDRSDPDNKLLEKVGEMFDDSGVLQSDK